MPTETRSKRTADSDERGRKRASRKAAELRDRSHGPRPLWSGVLTCGLVSAPVNLFPTTRSAGLPLRMLAPDATPLERRYACSAEGRDLDWSELVRGYEVDEGVYVELTDEELEAVALRKSRDIDLQLFTDASELEPLGCERAFVMTPSGDSTKPYRLLAEVMEREGKTDSIADGEGPDLFEVICGQLQGASGDSSGSKRGAGSSPKLRRLASLEELSKGELYDRAGRRDHGTQRDEQE